MLEASAEIKEKLQEMAHEASRPFCYSDYVKVEADENGQYRCPKCGSDDLMREVEGVGVEWGYDWVMEHLVETQGERVDIEELYRDLLDDIYEPVRFGELEYSPSAVLEAVDPVAFRIGAQENAGSAVEDSLMVCLNGNYYRISDIVE